MAKHKKTTQKNSSRSIWIIAAVLVVVIGVAGAAGIVFRDRTVPSDSPAVLEANRQIDVQQAYDLYQQGIFVLDVRTPEEYQAGHLPGATLIPLDELNNRAGELPVGEPILIYCRSGNRSLQAMNLLGQAGFKGLSSMDGGISAWAAAGYPVE